MSDPVVAADALVNVFAAAGMAVVAVETWRADPRGPVPRRFAMALCLIGSIFFVRALAWWSGSSVLDEIATVLAAAVPLMALIVTEGLLRRHAPVILKRLAVAGFAVILATTLVPVIPDTWRTSLLLALQVGGFLALGALLLTRDRASLSVPEEAMIHRVTLAVLLVIPTLVTDFRFLIPEIPVRLGAFGALLVIYLGFGAGNAAEMRARLVALAVFITIAAVLAFGFVAAAKEPTAGAILRAMAVASSGLLVAALISESLGARAERHKAVDPLVFAATTAEFESRILSHPLLSDAKLVSAPELAHVQHPDLDQLLHQRPLLLVREAPWSKPSTDAGVERALSLLSAYEATHLLCLSSAPMRLLLVALPPVSADRRAESELGVVRHLASLLYAHEAAA